jgi:3-hydroxybutyryl-CoA dehydrogenase
MNNKNLIGVVGSGAMGAGIAQVAGMSFHPVLVVDNNLQALKKAEGTLKATADKLLEKQKITAEQHAHLHTEIKFVAGLDKLAACDLVIEAIVENVDIKRALFTELENVTTSGCILASNTSSLSITSIAAAVKVPARVVGIHFFNPAPLMPLVEIVPGIATSGETTEAAKKIIDSWGKITVLAKDTPGFIVNRVARPFYGEALRIMEEGIASQATIDWAMKEIGGFRMGPFELMDMIGHDVNYIVTETVWKQFYYDPRFKPALTQKRLLEAGFLGRKSNRGFYDYSPGAALPEPLKDEQLGKKIVNRILVMLINEAADTLYLQVASAVDIDLAMTKGVNYPKGLLKWADELGAATIVQQLAALRDWYEEDRYRISPLLKEKALSGGKFHD